MNNKKFPLVVPSISKDIPKLLTNQKSYFDNLPIDKIIIIGNNDVEKMVSNNNCVEFINENSIVNFQHVKEYISTISNDERAIRRTGWYVQQFIKINYSLQCRDEYYLLWDSDTIPLKKIEMFDDNGKPFFDYKTEYHQPYFETISSLFPGLQKQIEGSFIAEHMIVNTSLMKKMISDITSSDTLPGQSFEEKVLSCINIKELPFSGFSEYETFGTYVTAKYPNSYSIREWKSMRFGGFFFDDSKSLTEDQIYWLSRKYDAISFEKGHYKSLFANIVQGKSFEKIFPSSILDALSVPIRGYRRAKRKISQNE